MNKYLEQTITFGQKCLEQVPVVVLGSGASLQYGVRGTGGLQDFLLKHVQPNDGEEAQVWESFTAKLKTGRDIETALHEVHLPQSLERKVVQQTRSMVLQDDQKIFGKFITDEIVFSLTALIRHFLRTTHPQISVITTNYDRLAEYACDGAGATYKTGLSDGYYRHFCNFSSGNPKSRGAQIVEILKVHGSVDWFTDELGKVVALPDSSILPAHLTPLLVTPGTGKYLATHEEPFRSIIARSDEAFEKARGVICIGYGFNDRHIQPKLTRRITQDSIPIIVFARNLTPNAKRFFSNCKKSCIALECSGQGSRVFSADYPNGIDISENIWEFGAFLNEAIGTC